MTTTQQQDHRFAKELRRLGAENQDLQDRVQELGEMARENRSKKVIELEGRIAELEAVLSAVGEKGDPVKPADIPSATDQDTHFFLAGWNGRAAQVDPHEHFRNAAATAPAHPTEGVPAQAAPQAQADARDAQMWALIDTAPKDGSWIQLWREPEKRIGDRAPLVFGRWHDEYESWVWPDQPHYDPFTERGIERANRDIEAGNAFRTDAFTHWHPLEKPALAAQAKKGGDA